MNFSILEQLNNFWQYNIISFGGNSIKISNITLTILFVYLGSIYYYRIIIFLSNKIILTQNDRQKDLLNRFLDSIVGILFFIFTLQIANIPISSLAFLGGTLVLGVGLGIQHLVNNLLSSFVLIVENPIHIGDLVTIDNCTGFVENIGHRCVSIRQSCNSTVFIPSSSFLQNKFINWTRNQSLVYQTKLTIPKHAINVDQISNIPELLAKNFNNPEILTSNIILLNISSDSYVYILEYRLSIKQNNVKQDTMQLDQFRNKLAYYVIEHLGDQITLEHMKST